MILRSHAKRMRRLWPLACPDRPVADNRSADGEPRIYFAELDHDGTETIADTLLFLVQEDTAFNGAAIPLYGKS